MPLDPALDPIEPEIVAPAPVTPKSKWAPVAGLLEKTAAQAVMVFLATFISVGTISTDLSTKAWVAAAGAALTVLANGAPQLAIPVDYPFAVQLVLRCLRSFVAAALAPIAGIYASTGGLPLDWDTWYPAFVGGAVVAMTIVKAAVAERFGGQTPALLPAHLDVAA